MSRGRLLEGAAFRPFRPPAGANAQEDAAEEERRRAQAVEQAAFERGLERARQKAEEQAQAAVDERLKQLDRALEELSRLRSRMLEELHDEIAGLVVEASARILRTRLEENDPVVSRVLEAVLSEAGGSRRWRVRLHPSDLERLRDDVGEPGGGIELAGDPEVTPGGVMVESSEESIDARVETAIASLRQAFEES